MQEAAKSQQENFADLLERMVIAVVREQNCKLGLFTADADKLKEAVSEVKAEILKALTQN